MLPAFIITGYLGSGKTTLLLNSARENFKERKVAIIVNEFGEVGVDGKVLQNAYSSVLELPEGCICCTLHAEFEKAIREIREKYDPEVLLVETSGGAEPFPVMVSLQSLGCSIEGVLCLIDAVNFENYKEDSTARHQIGSSNILVINKIDLVSEEELNKIEKEVLEVWERYKLKNLFTNEPVFKDCKVYKTSFAKLPSEVFSGVFVIRDKLVGLVEDNHSHHHAQEVLHLDRALSYEEFIKFMESLPKEVIRAKGIVRFEDSPVPVLVNYTFGSLDLGYPMPEYQGESFLVLIKSLS